MSKKKKAGNVVPFKPAAQEADEEQEQVDAAVELTETIRQLAEMDDLEYEQVRRAKAAELGIRVTKLDDAVKEVRRLHPRRQRQQPQPDPNDLESRLRPILETEGILDLWLQSWDKVMAGEHRNAKLLYLIATTRLFDKCMHAAIKGPSSAGKSEIRKQVLEFFPPEDIIAFVTLSEKALLYFESDFCHKILSMAEASGLQEQALQDTLLRELMSEGKLNYPVAQKIGGQIVTIPIVKNGPVCFMVTTTKAALHPENETRMLSLEIDDSEEQTRRVLKKLAQTAGRNIKPKDSVHYDWQDLQRLLRIVGNKNVVVPFADELAELIQHKKAVRLRRDFSQILACIKAHALIHCYRRENNERGELVADLELDYVPVAELLGHIVAEASGIAISKEVQETINAVAALTAKLDKDDGATSDKVAKHLKLDQSAAYRRLRVAINKGFVANLETRHRQPGRYRVTDQEIVAESLLPSVEEIRAYQALSAESGAKTAHTCIRTPKDEEAQGDSICTDECADDDVCAYDDGDANGSCIHQDAENADEKPAVCTYARKTDPHPGGRRPVRHHEG